MTNVHTYYQKIVSVEGDRICYMQEKTPDGTHAQTLDYPDVGDKLELCDIDSLRLIDTFTVTDVRTMPDEWMCRVELDHALPANSMGLILSNITWVPKTEIGGCSASSHNARSLLIKSRDVLIEGNSFLQFDFNSKILSFHKVQYNLQESKLHRLCCFLICFLLQFSYLQRLLCFLHQALQVLI